jgi:hypothetical protein
MFSMLIGSPSSFMRIWRLRALYLKQYLTPTIIQRLVKTTPKPRATKKSNGDELDPPLLLPPPPPPPPPLFGGPDGGPFKVSEAKLVLDVKVFWFGNVGVGVVSVRRVFEAVVMAVVRVSVA